MPPDFLNSREDAILLWGAVLLALLLFTNPRMVGSVAFKFVRAMPLKLVGVFLGTYAFAAFLVWLAWTFGLWHTDALKPTIYWFLGTALVLIGGAIAGGAGDFRKFLNRTVIARVLTVTVVIEFIANLYALPLAFEIVGVFLASTLNTIEPLVRRDSNANSLRGPVVWVPAAVVLVYLAYFAYRVLADFGSFATRDTAEDFLVGPALTLALIPWLFGWARFSRWEQDRIRRRFRPSTS